MNCHLFGNHTVTYNKNRSSYCTQAVPLFWSGRRDSNSRHPPWQGGTLPAELLPHLSSLLTTSCLHICLACLEIVLLLLPFVSRAYSVLLVFFRLIARNSEKKKPLASPYSPNTLRCKYHRRMCVSRPSSEWDGVGPHSFEHEGISIYGNSSSLIRVMRSNWLPYSQLRVVQRIVQKVKSSSDQNQSTQHVTVLACLAC
jgi:hypothetical protein